MAIKPVVSVPGVGIGIVAAEVITSSCVLKETEKEFSERYSTNKREATVNLLQKLQF